MGWDGYEVANHGPADRTDYPNTLIYDLRPTSKGSRLSELGRILGVPQNNLIAQPEAGAKVEYRVILGADFEPCQRATPRVYPTRTPIPTPAPQP